MEQWKPVVGFDGIYEISNMGRLKSLYPKKGKQMPIIEKRKTTPKGYIRVCLKKDGKSSLHMLHRIVAMAFIPNPNGLPFINHKNCNKTDNRSDNLEWITNIDNKRHAAENNLCPRLSGAKNGRAKKVLDLETGIVYDFAGEAAIAKGINPGTLRCMLGGKDRNWTSLRYV